MDEPELVSLLQRSWRLTFDAIPDLVAIIDSEYRIVQVNQAMASFLGTDAPSCVGKQCCLLIHGTDLPPEECPHSRMILDGKPHRQEMTNSMLGGDFVFSVSPLLAADGSVEGCIHIMHDVTERKQAQDLLHLRNRLSAALASSGDLSDALARIVDSILEIKDIDSCGVHLVDRGSGKMRLATETSLPQHYVELSHTLEPDSEQVKSAERGEPIYTGFTQYFSQFGNGDSETGARGLAIVPITWKESPVGLLSVGSLSQKEIPVHIRESLEAIALQVGGAIVRLQMQEKLRENRRNLENLFDAVDDYLVLFDSAGRIMRFNSAMSRRLGYSDEEATELTVQDLYQPDLRASARSVIEGVVSGTVSAHSLPLMARSGEVIPVETTIATAPWGDRTVKIGVSRDVSGIQRAEKTRHALSQISEAVFESHDLYDLVDSIHQTIGTLIDAANFFVAIYDDQEELYTFPYFCDEVEDLTEFEHPDPLKGSLTDYVRRSAKPLLLTDELDADLQDRGEIKGIVGAPTKSWAGVPLFDPKGHVFGVMVVQSYEQANQYSEDDLALLVVASSQIAVAVERKRAEEALRERESRLRSVFRAAPVGIGLVSRRILKEVNEKLCEMTGYSAEELQDQSARILYPSDEEFNYVGEAKYEQIKQYGTGTVETKWQHKEGHIIEVILSSTPLDPNDWARGVTFTAMDITDRKRAEDERLQFERQLQHAQKLESLGVLAGGIAHDFNNLLVGIMGNADLALLDLEAGSPSRNYVEEIEITAHRAAELCRQMLAYSGKGRFVVEPLDLSILVEEMVHLLNASISKKAVLKLDLESEIPAVDADATQLRQVVMNLMTNASEALNGSAGRITVTTGSATFSFEELSDAHAANELPEGHYVFLEVADTGCGMDEPTATRIFDPFFTTKFSGRGLGLAAVQGIVYGHQGGITVDSESGKGTVIRVFFPASSRPAVQSGGSKPVEGGWSSEGSVLVVDDDEAVRLVARQMLEKLGFRVIEAEDGREAVSMLDELPDDISLILLDMTMPHMDGEETFLELRRQGCTAPVVLSSGHDEQEATHRLAGKGLSGFIQKPYRIEDLRERIQAALGGITLAGTHLPVVSVLVVDDDEDLVILTEQSLKILGYIVETASTGDEAVEIMKQRGAQISVVLLDIAMPGFSGLETLQLIKERSPSTKVVVFSGRAFDSTAQEMLDGGADDFLHKTLSRDVLDAKIRSVLEKPAE